MITSEVSEKYAKDNKDYERCELVTPPADFAAWEHARLHNRGLSD